MAVRVRLDPIDRDIKLLLSQELSPQRQAEVFKQFARQEINSAKTHNRAILRRDPRMIVTVDGSENESLSSVKVTSVVIAEFEVVLEALGWISTQLQTHSPVKSGRYVKSHELFADGEHVENPNNAPVADRYVFLNVQPYARKLELGSSSQAPAGVYQAVAKLAQKFGNVAKISFGYESAVGFASMSGWAGSSSAKRWAAAHGRRSDTTEWLTRQPAIIVSLGDQ